MCGSAAGTTPTQRGWPRLATILDTVARSLSSFLGRNLQPAAVIELDDEIILPEGAGAARRHELRGTFHVLELGHEGTDWATRRPRIHVELCDFRSGSRQSEERRKGVWVESHATYDYLDSEQQ